MIKICENKILQKKIRKQQKNKKSSINIYDKNPTKVNSNIQKKRQLSYIKFIKSKT